MADSDWYNAAAQAQAAVQGLSNAVSGDLSYEQNRALMWAQQHWNWTAMEHQNAWNDSQRVKQNEWSELMYGKYDSPQAKANQLAAAGLNPRLAAENGQGVGSSSGSNTGGSLPPGVNPPYKPLDSPSTQITSIASAAKDLADARKSGVESGRISTLLNREAQSMDLQMTGQNIRNYVDSQTLLPRQRAEINKIINEAVGTAVNSEQVMQIVYSKIIENQMLLHRLNNFPEWYQSELKKLKTEGGLNEANTEDAYASASEHRAGAFLKGAQERGVNQEIRESEARIQSMSVHNALETALTGVAQNDEKLRRAQYDFQLYENSMRDMDVVLRKGLFDEEFYTKLEEYENKREMMKKQLKEISAHIKLLKSQGKHEEVKVYTDIADSISRMLTGTASLIGAVM